MYFDKYQKMRGHRLRLCWRNCRILFGAEQSVLGNGPY